MGLSTCTRSCLTDMSLLAWKSKVSQQRIIASIITCEKRFLLKSNVKELSISTTRHKSARHRGILDSKDMCGHTRGGGGSGLPWTKKAHDVASLSRRGVWRYLAKSMVFCISVSIRLDISAIEISRLKMPCKGIPIHVLSSDKTANSISGSLTYLCNKTPYRARSVVRF